MKNLWILFFVLLFTRFSAQDDNYYEKWYNADDSKLPQNTVKSIVKDKYGFLWLSTENGIVRFDGKNFITYDIQLPSIENRTLLIDGCVEDDWLFTFYNPGTIPGMIRRRNFSIISKKDTSTLRKLKHYGDENLYKLVKDSADRVLKGKFHYFLNKNENYSLDNHRLFYNKGKKSRFIKVLKDHFYGNFFILGDQLFYFRNSSVVEKIDKSGLIKEYTTGIGAKAKDFDYFINSANKQLLIRNNGRIYLVEYINDSLISNLICDSETLKGLSLTCMYYDKSTKTLFAGTFSKGLLMIREKFIKAYNTAAGKTIFHALTGYNEREVITADGDIFGADGYKASLPFINHNSYGIVKLQNPGEFVLKSEHRVDLWSRNKNIILKNFGIQSSVYAISGSSGNKIWVSLDLKGEKLIGYIIIRDSKIIKEKFYNIKVSVKGISEVSNQKILLATEKGLYLFDENKRVRKMIMPNVNFRSINNNGDDLFWVQTYGKGLYLYKNGRLYSMRQKNPLLASVHSVIDDGLGYYWLSSNSGLFQVKKQTLIDAYLKGTPDIYIYKYSLKDGLLTSEFNGGANINGIRKNGFVVFPSMNGLIYINTVQALPIVSGEDFYIDRVSINEKEKNIRDVLNLERNFGYVKIFVDYIDFGNPGNDYIDYKIDDDKWLPLPENSIININSLTNGRHEIHVRKLNSFSSAYTYKTLEIDVRPAFWETEMFRLFVVIIMLLIFYVIYKMRMARIQRESVVLNMRIEKRTQELKDTIKSLSKTREELYAQLYRQKKLVAAISHDIKSPLKFINISAGILLENIQEDSHEKKTIHSINESSSQILEFIESTINYNKIFIYDNYHTRENIKLRDFINQRSAIFKNTAAFKSLQIQNNIGEKDKVVSNTDVLSIIIHNILDNAIKYTDEGAVYIYTGYKENKRTLVIEDTGRGMSQEEVEKINDSEYSRDSRMGMKIIREMLPLIDVSIEVRSVMGKGTKVILTFTTN
ncbi:sensor histidine kinase [Chryseobacterium taeanense]|uniref:sensor histidine kinase n=1 Tax=Chryseobacterium taeanense TaxID=311334 RepID=UPI0035AEB921